MIGEARAAFRSADALDDPICPGARQPVDAVEMVMRDAPGTAVEHRDQRAPVVPPHAPVLAPRRVRVLQVSAANQRGQSFLAAVMDIGYGGGRRHRVTTERTALHDEASSATSPIPFGIVGSASAITAEAWLSEHFLGGAMLKGAIP